MNHPALRLWLATAALAATSAHAQNCVQVEVHNLRPQQGMLMVAAYTEAADFNKKPASTLQMRAGAETMRFSLCGLDGPSVALALYQDVNGNGQLDRSVLGVPTEPWGASGKPPAFAAPTWETSQVPLDGSAIVVQLSK